ncbi:hypothetical protein VFPPC_01784 [Pochonia chlamydosporia 170]|uniref:Uncharacterized protein n=1 Tax=Pochonia chlamydosporia 170 TaxID=1380566 RepID=A0A179G8U9_METCM|nr:hypothetical protein VFPPC_01784 [Pochonia chlamydosporia 170]OAQ74235.1 hypothetical protein VFPPC_01784 [Pochonia chlamydosporia 170]
MDGYTDSPGDQSATTASIYPSYADEAAFVTIPYSDTTEAEPPIPLIPPKSPERDSRECSEEPLPSVTDDSASSVYAESENPTLKEVIQSVEEHTCTNPPPTAEPMSASIYEVAWDEMFPAEEIYDEATGLPAYIAPWIIRSESDDEQNAKVADWKPAPLVPPLRRRPGIAEQMGRPLPKWKQGGDVESVTSQTPKKKRNFWMSFRRSKKALTASITGSSQSLTPLKSTESSNPKTDSSIAQPQGSVSSLINNGKSGRGREDSVAKVAVENAGKMDSIASRPKSLVVDPSDGKYGNGVSVEEVEVAQMANPKEEVDEFVLKREVAGSHKITMAIPEGKILNDELRARLCC